MCGHCRRTEEELTDIEEEKHLRVKELEENNPKILS